MKVHVSTSLLPRMADSYREWAQRRSIDGDPTASDTALTAADALDDIIDLRKALDRALGAWERYLAEHHKRDPAWPPYEANLAEIEQLKRLVRP